MLLSQWYEHFEEALTVNDSVFGLEWVTDLSSIGIGGQVGRVCAVQAEIDAASRRAQASSGRAEARRHLHSRRCVGIWR